jgi:protein Mpv17
MALPARAFLARQMLQRRLQFLPKRSQSTHNSHPKEPLNTNFTQHGPANLPTSDLKTIPGPIWVWTQPLNSYSRVHKRRPYTVQIVSTLIIYFFGDMAAQRINPTPQDNTNETASTPSSTYDPQRTVRALLIGGLAAIPGYHWFLYLARNFNYTSKAGSIVVKVLVNQIVFTPIFNSYFFGMQSALSGAGLSEIVERIKNTVPTSWKNSWKLWPAVTAFSFAFVRVELRGLFAGVIAIGWQTYLSILNQRAAKMEKGEHTPMKGDVENEEQVAARA